MTIIDVIEHMPLEAIIVALVGGAFMIAFCGFYGLLAGNNDELVKAIYFAVILVLITVFLSIFLAFMLIEQTVGSANEYVASSAKAIMDEEKGTTDERVGLEGLQFVEAKDGVIRCKDGEITIIVRCKESSSWKTDSWKTPETVDVYGTVESIDIDNKIINMRAVYRQYAVRLPTL